MGKPTRQTARRSKSMDNIAVAKRVVDRIVLATDLDPVLHLLDDDLSFEVALPMRCRSASGIRASRP